MIVDPGQNAPHPPVGCRVFDGDAEHMVAKTATHVSDVAHEKSVCPTGSHPIGCGWSAVGQMTKQKIRNTGKELPDRDGGNLRGKLASQLMRTLPARVVVIEKIDRGRFCGHGKADNTATAQ